MKSYASLLICLLPAAASLSQGVFNNQTSLALQRVIADFPNKFRDIRGSRVNANGSLVSFESKVAIPGARNIIIIQHGAGSREAYEWKCELSEAGSFSEGKARYREVFDRIKNSIINIQGRQPFILNGIYDPPLPENRTTRVYFQLLPSTGDLRTLKVELALQERGSRWVITLRVFSLPDADLVQSE